MPWSFHMLVKVIGPEVHRGAQRTTYLESVVPLQAALIAGEQRVRR